MGRLYMLRGALKQLKGFPAPHLINGDKPLQKTGMVISRAIRSSFGGGGSQTQAHDEQSAARGSPRKVVGGCHEMM